LAAQRQRVAVFGFAGMILPWLWNLNI